MMTLHTHVLIVILNRWPTIRTNDRISSKICIGTRRYSTKIGLSIKREPKLAKLKVVATLENSWMCLG